jgi:DNA-binding Lrp family transcriptional regulator
LEPGSDRGGSRSGRDAVVDDDDRSRSRLFGCEDARHLGSALRHDRSLFFDRASDPLGPDPDALEEVGIEEGGAIGTDGADRQFGVTGRSDLPSEDGAQGQTRLASDFRRHGDAAARDSRDETAGLNQLARVERVGQPEPGIAAIGKNDVRHDRYDAPSVAADPGGFRMAVTAYVLIQTEVGKAVNVAEAARKISGVLSADDVTGPYDVIVKTEAASLDELGKLVVSQIQAVEGITRTFTCPVVNL